FIEGSILTTTFRPGHNPVRERVTQTTSPAASSASQSALGRRLATKGHRDPGPIRPGSVPSGNEGDRLSRQNRKAPRRRSDHPQLEHARESRENPWDRKQKPTKKRKSSLTSLPSVQCPTSSL